MKKLIWVLISLLVVSNGVTAYFLYQSYKSKPAPVVVPPIVATLSIPVATSTEPVVVNADTDTDNDGINDLDEQELYKTYPAKADTDGDGYSDKEELDFGFDPLTASQTAGAEAVSEIIEVDWQTPVDITPQEFFGTEAEMKAKYPKAFNAKGQFVWPEYEDYVISFYGNDNNFYQQFYSIKKVGIVKNGMYQGKDFYIMSYHSCLGGCMGGVNTLRFIDSGQGYVCLSKHSDGCFSPAIFQTDKMLYAKNLVSPKLIRIPNSKILLEKILSTPFFQPENASTTLAFVSGDNKVYADGNLFRIIQPDDSSSYYSYQLPFRKESGVLDISWLDGTTNENTYDSKGGPCGGVGFAYADYVSTTTLKQAGTTGDGSIIYELADPQTADTAIDSEAVLKKMYDNEYAVYDRENKMTYAEFLLAKPLIFWQDPFGGFVEFKNSLFAPMAECGKPVIYLYPEKESQVSVRVSPTGGFKLTEPSYDNGWQVTAKPNGELTNLSDGLKYPYLFWEGYAYDYVRPSQGFVVPENKVKPFLEKIMAKLGLIKIEADEFIAFWEPKMHEKPYYFISFVPKEQFDRMAPLAVSPEPDTVIRVFMDYQGLDAPAFAMSPKIITPERRGFTVVEWGGAVHR